MPSVHYVQTTMYKGSSAWRVYLQFLDNAMPLYTAFSISAEWKIVVEVLLTLLHSARYRHAVIPRKNDCGCNL
jgi:hypothetical protein